MTTTNACCHCCKTCYPNSKVNPGECEICTRLGKVCPFGHGRCGNQIKNSGIIKYEDIKRIGITTPVRISSIHKPGRIFSGRPVSLSKAGPIKHSLGPALPLYFNPNQSVDHAINITPGVNYSKTYPLNQSPILSNTSAPLGQNPIVNNSVIIKPSYYDL